MSSTIALYVDEYLPNISLCFGALVATDLSKILSAPAISMLTELPVWFILYWWVDFHSGYFGSSCFLFHFEALLAFVRKDFNIKALLCIKRNCSNDMNTLTSAMSHQYIFPSVTLAYFPHLHNIIQHAIISTPLHYG